MTFLNAMTQDKKICIGEISNVHGVRGQLLVRCFADDPELLLIKDAVTDEKGTRTFNFQGLSPHKKAYLTRLDGLDNREDAEKLKRTRLYIERDQLPELDSDEIYHVDLIGMTVKSDDKIIGKIAAVQNFGASDLLEIQREGAKNFYLPYSDETILNVDGDTVDVAIPGGLLELYD